MGWIPKHLKEKYERQCGQYLPDGRAYTRRSDCNGRLMLQYDNYGELHILCTTPGCVCEPLNLPVAQ